MAHIVRSALAVPLLGVILLCRGETTARAVVVAGAYATQSDAAVNTAPPSDDPGFYNVGQFGGATAIYMGNDWVLTASHVSGSNTSFKFLDRSSSQLVTATYQTVTNSGVVLKNPAGQFGGTNSDLMMYKIDPSSSPYGEPNLPQLLIAPSAPTGASKSYGGDLVMAIGRGLDRGDSYTYWDDSRPTWQTTTAGSAVHTGYVTTGPQQVRWGQNLVTDSNVVFNLGTTSNPIYQHGYTTTFDQYGSGKTGLPNEFQVSYLDSGGAVFADINGYWFLSGMIDSVALLAGQPWGAPYTAAYGEQSVIADLSAYRSQILALNPLYGDVNNDGIVNAADITIVASNWLRSGAGDVNNDGIVNAADVTIIASQWSHPRVSNGIAAASPQVAGATAVPEPATLVMAAAAVAALAGLWCVRRLRRD